MKSLSLVESVRVYDLPPAISVGRHMGLYRLYHYIFTFR